MVLLLAGAKPDAIWLGAGPIDAIYSGADLVWTPPARLTAVHGAFSRSGGPAALSAGRRLAADASPYTAGGADARFIKAVGLPAAASAFALKGVGVTLLYTEGTKFPVVQSSATTQINTNQATHSINMPAGVAAGDLLLVFAGLASDSKWDVGLWDQATWDANTTVSPPVGWTEHYDLASGTNGRACVYSKVASGGEGATQDFTLQNGACRGSWTVLRVDTYAGSPEFSIAGENTTDPPNLVPTWGTDKTLFLSAMIGAGSRTVSAYPSGYSAAGGTSGGNNHCWVSSRELEASSDNPGAFTMSGATEARAVTAAIRGD